MIWGRAMIQFVFKVLNMHFFSDRAVPGRNLSSWNPDNGTKINLEGHSEQQSLGCKNLQTAQMSKFKGLTY